MLIGKGRFVGPSVDPWSGRRAVRFLCRCRSVAFFIYFLSCFCLIQQTITGISTISSFLMNITIGTFFLAALFRL